MGAITQGLIMLFLLHEGLRHAFGAAPSTTRSLLSTRPIREEEEGRGPSSRKKRIRRRWIVIGATCNYSNLPG